MKNFLFPILGFTCAVFISSCDDKEHKTSNFSKDGSVEIVFQTSHLNDSFDILTTTKNVYKSGQVVKSISNIDTLPTLGTGTVQGENDNGDSRSYNLKKDYDLFVTIK